MSRHDRNNIEQHRVLANGLTIKVAVVKAVSPTVRDSIQLKWKLMGCSYEQPFLYGGLHGAEASKIVYCKYEI